MTFESATLSYDGGAPALADVDLKVAAGETVAIVGPTGSGKTTLAAAVPRLYDLTERRPCRSTASTSATSTSTRCASRSRVVPDDGFLFSASVRENIAYARPEASLDEIRLAARRAQIDSFIDGLPTATTRWSASAA